ncbi:MAG: D-2-hydroxyacid dehydrogenase [Treponema sp.]|jgi:glycerate dehydrogenase|nr:D-2-hydroxyacid dehydrogenase [Treponema sp.]
MKIVILDGYALNPGDLSWEGFETMGDLIVYDRTGPEERAERIGGAEIVLTNKTPLDAGVLGACSSIKYIGVLATGYNVVDTAAAEARGIAVTNVPGYSTPSVAQTVFALLLEICLHPGAHSEAVRAGRWIASRDYCFWDYPLLELAGKTFGILGLGSIGKAAARIARAFGMEVIAHSRSQTAEGGEYAAYVSLEELFAQSDVISLHCPAFPETGGIINRDTIARMKDGVILINTARGSLIKEQDLTDALNTGKVYAAGLDVISEEPMRPGNPLLGAKNCIFTPHIAWASKESRKRLLDAAVENLKGFLQGRPVNLVNSVPAPPGSCKSRE